MEYMRNFISPSFLKQEMRESLLLETTNKNIQFSNWKTWILNAILDVRPCG